MSQSAWHYPFSGPLRYTTDIFFVSDALRCLLSSPTNVSRIMVDVFAHLCTFNVVSDKRRCITWRLRYWMVPTFDVVPDDHGCLTYLPTVNGILLTRDVCTYHSLAGKAIAVSGLCYLLWPLARCAILRCRRRWQLICNIFADVQCHRQRRGCLKPSLTNLDVWPGSALKRYRWFSRWQWRVRCLILLQSILTCDAGWCKSATKNF